jgi:hypothetical protein
VLATVAAATRGRGEMGEDWWVARVTPYALGAREPAVSMALEPPRYAGLLP